MENFEQNKPQIPEKNESESPEVKEYFDAYKEWSALSDRLSKLFTKKKFLIIAEELDIYKIADQNLINKANKINAPLPEKLLVDLSHQYLKILVQEIRERFKDELEGYDGDI